MEIYRLFPHKFLWNYYITVTGEDRLGEVSLGGTRQGVFTVPSPR